MGMDLNEMEQEAYEIGWESALLRCRLAIEKDGLSGAALTAHLIELAGNPPDYVDEWDAIIAAEIG